MNRLQNPALPRNRALDVPRTPDSLAEAERLRGLALQCSDRLLDGAARFKLPEDWGALQIARDRLIREEYRILVIGEANRGKSSLVNALVGRRHLPADLKVSTSQLFRVRHSEQEAFQVRFEDGTSRSIEPAELGAYGSQLAFEAGEPPPLGQMVRWIDVELPFHLLPKHIEFFDTPGVGGLRAAHGEIARRMLPEADGVIFVVDSERPVDESELRFLEEALRTTPNVFFVQTKIDLREDDWTAIRDKSAAHLRARFGDSLPDARIWPFSSVRFQRALELSDQGADRKAAADLALAESRFSEFYPALMTFLYRVVGWSRAAAVALAAGQYHRVGEQTLRDRFKALRNESWRNEHRSLQAEQHRRFSDESTEFVQLKNRLQTALRDETREARFELQRGIERIEREIRYDIASVASLAEAQELAAQMEEDALRDAAELWTQLRFSQIDVYSKMLAEFFKIAEPERFSVDQEALDSGAPALRLEGDLVRRLQTAGGCAAGFGAVFGGVPTGAAVLIGIMNPPLGALLATVGGIATLCGFFAGWRASTRAEAESSRAKLAERLSQTLATIRFHYIRAADRLSRHLESSLRNEIERTADRKRREAENELERMRQEESLTARERVDRTREVELQAETWRAIGPEIESLHANLLRLHDRLVVSAKGAGS